MSMDRIRIGVISDTHGLLRTEALEELKGCDQIVHAGDVGKPEVLDALSRIAPVTAVCGNVDNGEWARALPETAVVQTDCATLYVLHDLHQLDLDPAAAGFRVVISGHSHRAHQEWRRGVLYLNPGAAGPRRFGLPATLARLIVERGRLEVEPVELEGS